EARHALGMRDRVDESKRRSPRTAVEDGLPDPERIEKKGDVLHEVPGGVVPGGTVGPRASGAALIKEEHVEAPEIEKLLGLLDEAGAGPAMKEHRGDAAAVAAALEVEPVPLADGDEAFRVGFHEGTSL